MKALFLIRDLPYPATHGYKKRNYFLIRALARRDINIALFVEEADKNSNEAIAHLKSYCKDVMILGRKKQNKLIAAFLSLFSALPFSIKLRTFPEVRAQIARYLSENPQDLIICDAIHRALNIPFDNKTPKLLYEHNIESTIIKRYSKFEKNMFKKIFALIEYLKFKNIEPKIWRMFDCAAACSLHDKKIMQKRTNAANIIVVNNGVESGYFNPDPYEIVRNSIVYSGQIGWHPNEDAIIYFVENIYPLIKEKNHGVKFWIVGDKPSKRVKETAKNDKSIIVTGFVKDIRDYIGKAHVFVVPLRIGGGTRLKILEALSMKKAVVTTSVGCEGLETENNKHLLIRDNPRDFASAVLDILEDKPPYQNLGKEGRGLIEKKYDWGVVFEELNKVLAP
ncbi:MAG: hypothetical protein COV72_02905 [Candidatus Omnitrophica bacterium CG11_big_fil_rev_8_21_14_0_20_42_13]|uniref:Glycosyltransferase subfamily 4-like N-terminal domain-containing protein n=1 Tax=Candidatus Ghiorseimicrobium undicola TaxID=1974746 RepID=A0A2H0LYM4_9BACT|nr:MAG: hypothetical protein COV72_02905 [Candidatus Omnitrophica bacterium CG11_big_fil_rev_8_21_14_0_20_42_13]